jgi:hypothetical protein
MLGRREEVKPKNISLPLPIFELAMTGVALMISKSAVTQFSSTISASVVNHMR